MTYGGCGLSHSTPSPAAPDSWKYDGSQRATRMASQSFSVHVWFCFLLELAWYLEIYLSKDCHVTGLCICRSEVLEPAWFLLFLPLERWSPSWSDRPSPALLPPPFLWICTRLLTFGGRRCDCLNWQGQGVVLYLWTLKGWKTLANWFPQWTLKNFWDQFPMGDSVSENWDRNSSVIIFFFPFFGFIKYFLWCEVTY